jgi:putative hydrolase of HD superfamily
VAHRAIHVAVLSADDIIDVVQGLDTLSDLPRTGWLLRGVRPCESIADHSYGVGLVSMLLVDALRARGAEVDGERVLRMALLHDAAEARTGDVPMPSKTDEIADALHRVEHAIVDRILPADHVPLWRESERGESLEARIVKAADKIQMMVKVLTYQRQHRGDLHEFWRNPRNFDDRGIDVAGELFDAICRRAGVDRPR